MCEIQAATTEARLTCWTKERRRLDACHRVGTFQAHRQRRNRSATSIHAVAGSAVDKSIFLRTPTVSCVREAWTYLRYMLSSRQLIEYCELPESLGVKPQTGHRAAFDCEGRAVFDLEWSGGKEVRYSLSALWDDTLPLLFGIGLNPSTARAVVEDKTVSRAIRETRAALRYGGLFWINLGAQMETEAAVFIAAGRAQGRHNSEQLRIVLERLHPEETCRDVVLAWGSDGPKLADWIGTTTIDPRVRLLTFTKTLKGHPRHPSRLKAGTALVFE